MGPKPFTPPKLNETETFDKVFNVPIAPGNHTNGLHPESEPVKIEITPAEETKPCVGEETNNSPDEEICVKDAKEVEVADVKEEQPDVNDEDDIKQECDNNGLEADEDYVPKTPSTAERRKIFEVTANANKENESEDTLESLDGNNFERASLQRNSIAERRKMYERSQSVQETAPTSAVTTVDKPDGSPVMLRRKDSFKNRKCADVLKEDNAKKVMPKQQSLDPQAGKKNEAVSTPTPKRTSTVFGLYHQLIFHCESLL